MRSLDIGQVFRRTATAAEKCIGGTKGAIYAIFLNTVANNLSRAAASLAGNNVEGMIRQALQGGGLEELCRYTPARVGHRTLMDALTPMIRNFVSPKTFAEAVAEACKGAEGTRQMTAALGRTGLMRREGSRPRGSGVSEHSAGGQGRFECALTSFSSHHLSHDCMCLGTFLLGRLHN